MHLDEKGKNLPSKSDLLNRAQNRAKIRIYFLGDETDSFPSSTSSLSSDPKIKLLQQQNETPPLRDVTSNHFERA